MHIDPVKPPNILGRFRNINMPHHEQQIIRTEGEQVKGKYIKSQCYQKRDKGKDQERKMLKGEANSLDMEPEAFRQGFEGFEHVSLLNAFSVQARQLC
jgi:hypothetical protein